MKLYLILLLFFTTSIYAQSTFCAGWDDGYTTGMKSKNITVYIIPVCPIPGIHQDIYQVGYNKGYEKATGSSVVSITPTDKASNNFCNGWEKGFAAAMTEYNKGVYITPICPISAINEDSYDDGFARGYQSGLDKLNITKKSDVVVIPEKGKSFCDGWERGYGYGLEEWAIENNKTKALRITPVCPIPKINEDTYVNGFKLGKEQAKLDLGK